MGAIAEGMAWGAGSAIGHRAIDSMFGPRQIEHVHTQQDGGDAAGAGGASPVNDYDTLGNQGSEQQESEFGWHGDGGGMFGDDGGDDGGGGDGGGWGGFFE